MVDAILEGAQKQCSEPFTDGEELRNSFLSYRRITAL